MKQFYKKYIILTALFVSLFAMSSSAQNNTLYWMKHLPQSMNTNPAKQSNCKFFIDIPVLPNFSFDVAHTGFSFDDVIMDHPTATDSFMFDLITLEKVLGENRNSIDFETEFSLINFGLSLKNNLYVTFGVNYKISENFQYPKALIEITKGNYRAHGEPLSFNFKENFMAHREFYLGLSKNFDDRFTIGGRLKFLNGYANVNAKKMNLDWYTSIKEEDIYDWNFNSDFEINASLPVEWDAEYDSLGNLSTINFAELEIDTTNIYGSIKEIIPHNFGLGIDLGIEYKITKNILLSASVVDFGFIRWKTNSGSLTQKTTFTFDGLDIANYVGSYEEATDGTATEEEQSIGDDILDSLKTAFNPTIVKESYTTGLNTKIYLGGNIAVNDWLDFGLLYRGAVINSSLYSSYTASSNLNFFKGWSYSVSYSVIGREAHNIGMGLAYKIGPFQMYLITDNVAAPFWAINESAYSDNLIRNTKRANFSFGMNFMICKKRQDIGLLE